MNKQKQRDLLKFQLDHQPRKRDWSGMAYTVAVLAFIAACSIVIGCEITWRDFCG